MGGSLAFHIVFAAIGVAMPLLMVLAEGQWLRTRDPVYRELARAWAKGTAVLFAVGAVSGTVLSFELGLLFPEFMRLAGPLIGPGFTLEGVAFFTEAIFLGLYLYGWERLEPRLHLAAGVVVALSGVASAALVTLVNAWMQHPTGVEGLGPDGFTGIDPLAALFSPYALHELPHSILGYYLATGFAVAGVHAWALGRSPQSAFHRHALRLALWIAIPSALLTPLVGHYAGQRVATLQPLKLAAVEGHYETARAVPLTLGGFPDHDAAETTWALEVPYGLSILATNDPQGEVQGLLDFPRELWPPAYVRHAFQVMVALGSGLALLALVAIGWLWRQPERLPAWLRWAFVVSGPAAFVALEAGWIAAEVGRQPWTVVGYLKTADVVTPVGGLWIACAAFAVLYLGLAAAVVGALRWIVRQREVEARAASDAQPAADEPAADEPAADEPAADEPATDERGGDA